MLNRIYLTGFMTSGKSTIGPILANVLGWNFVDLDARIEDAEGKKIVDIFNEKGETVFRNIESSYLKEVSEMSNIIISLGGGTLTLERNLRLVKETGKLIYLKVTPEVLYKRLKNKIDRPLFRNEVLNEVSEDDFIEKINGLLEARKNSYESADLIFNTDDTSIGKTVDQIANQIKKLTGNDD